MAHWTMFGINLLEVLVVGVAVSLIFGSLFLPDFYKNILQYVAAAMGVFMFVRWLLRRRRTPPQ